MEFVKGDILDAEHGIIGHQVNCQLVMDTGLAKQVRDKYPHVFSEYKAVMSTMNTKQRLGKCQMVVAKPPNVLFVANLFGQLHFRPKGMVHTDCAALGAALRNLQRWQKIFFPTYPIFLPNGLGCSGGRGEWSIVEGIIRDAIPNAIIVRRVNL